MRGGRHQGVEAPKSDHPIGTNLQSTGKAKNIVFHYLETYTLFLIADSLQDLVLAWSFAVTIVHMETTAHITASRSPGLRKQEAAAVPSHGDSHAVSKRLQSELMSLMASADPGVSAFPDGDSLFSWLGSIQGVQGTAYDSLNYKLSLKFPSGDFATYTLSSSGFFAKLQTARNRDSY